MPHRANQYKRRIYPGITAATMQADANPPSRRKLLGAFIRAHRERVRPDAELAAGRRRTPGLRREELAVRAGISSTWCAWIEQGRDVQASPEALARVAEALALSRAERAYLFQLAARLDPDAPDETSSEDAPASLLAIVQQLQPPAYGLDRLWNAVCWNAAAADLFRGWLDAEAETQRNLLRYVFLHPSARALIPEWQERARRLLAEFRADYSQTFRDARVRGLVESLRRQSPLFAAAWEEQGVRERAGGIRTFAHPARGALSFTQHTLTPSERPDYKLVVLVPVTSSATDQHESRTAGTRRSPAKSRR
jgi:transcriptional regulator with XRE-family HTH domain